MTRRRIKGRTFEDETPHGSTVKVFVAAAGDQVQLTFVPSKGKNFRKGPTRIGLSRAAMETLAELWRQHLEFEEKKSQLQYRAMMIVRRLIPWAWAGIPPVQIPEDFRRIEGTWTVKQPESESKSLP